MQVSCQGKQQRHATQRCSQQGMGSGVCYLVLIDVCVLSTTVLLMTFGLVLGLLQVAGVQEGTASLLGKPACAKPGLHSALPLVPAHLRPFGCMLAEEVLGSSKVYVLPRLGRAPWPVVGLAAPAAAVLPWPASFAGAAGVLLAGTLAGGLAAASCFLG